MRTDSPAATTGVVEDGGLARARWAYPSVVLLSLALVFVVLSLWRADLRVPFTYHAEALFNGMLVKGTLERGWPLHYPALGAPAGLDLRDLPMSDNNLHFVLIRLLGLASSDYAVVMNLFFLLTFPATAVSALYVFRRFRLAAGPAICGSLLYTFLPFHFSRAQHHLFLAAYYLVPLAVLVTLWIASGALALVEEPERRWSWRWCRGKLIASSIICVLLASSGTYYAFFACFLFLTAGALRAVRRRNARYLALPVALVVWTFAVLAANFWPSIVYLRQHGETPLVWRSPADAEIYGLKISQVLLPVTGHRLGWVAQFKDVVNVRLVTNESDDASLGVIGSLGFLALLGWLVRPKRETTRVEGRTLSVLDDLSILNLSALLLATMGGFGALVALTITSKIRAYNRISVYIAFFSIFAVVVGLDHVFRRYGHEGRRRDALMIGLAALTVLAVLDQTSARAVSNYETVAAEYRSDAAFVHQLQAAMPPGAMIFQMPVVQFPEHPPIHRMQDYDHTRGYLHAGQLRWSYGAMKGREGGAWQTWVTAKPAPQLIETLAAAGFSGLYLNRSGYADGGAKLTAEISGALGQPAWSSPNRRLLFFDLTGFRHALRARHTPEEWEAKQEAALHPLLVVWENGCSDLEGTPQNSFRWCSAGGEWRLTNGAREAKRVTLDMSFLAHHEGTLWIRSPLLSEQIRVGPVSRALSKTISVPPGQHTIPFACDAPRVLASGDRRHLVFRIINFRIIDD